MFAFARLVPIMANLAVRPILHVSQARESANLFSERSSGNPNMQNATDRQMFLLHADSVFAKS